MTPNPANPDPARREPVLHPLPRSSTAVKRVLIVDDEADIVEAVRELVEAVAEEFRPEVRTAMSGAEGLILLGTRKFDLIVSDFQMGAMNGVDFLRAVQELQPGVPCVLMSGNPDLVHDKLADTDISNTVFLTKPFAALDLERLLLTGLGWAEPA